MEDPNDIGEVFNPPKCFDIKEVEESSEDPPEVGGIETIKGGTVDFWKLRCSQLDEKARIRCYFIAAGTSLWALVQLIKKYLNKAT